MPTITNLLVPEHTDIDLATEFQNILNWAKDNRMMVNISKTKKLVFHRPSAKPPLPCPLTDIEQVVTAKLLGVTVHCRSWCRGGQTWGVLTLLC